MVSMIIISCALLASALPELESMPRDPYVTPYGIVMTDGNCNRLFAWRNDSLILLISSPGCGRYYTISFDRKSIGYKSINEKGLQAPALLDIRSGDKTLLHDWCTRAGQVSFAANGAIAYTVDNILHLTNGLMTTHYDLGVYANYTCLSPDNTRIVYNDNEDQLWILAFDTGVRTRITPVSGYGYCIPRWSSDSRFILYQRLDSHLYAYDTHTRETHDLPEGCHAQWATDSRHIIYHVPEVNYHDLVGSDLYMVMCDGSDIRQLTNTRSRYEMDPRFYQADQVIFCAPQAKAIMTAQVSDNDLVDVQEIVRWDDAMDMEFHKVDIPAGRDSLDVPYFNQVYDTPDWFNGHWACAPSTALMAILYFEKLPVWACWCSSPYGHISDYGRYICEHYRYREIDYTWQAQDPSGNWATGGYGYMWSGSNRPYTHMASYLNDHDLVSWRDDSPTFNEVITELNAGYPYGMCVGLTTAGHLVLAVGQVLNWYTLICNDPYGNKNTPGYPSYDGKYARYDWPGSNNGYENLNTIYWCVGAQGEREPLSDTLVDDLQFGSGFYLHTELPSSMGYWHDSLIGFNEHLWWTYTTASSTQDTCYAQWTPRLSVAGNYEVFANIPAAHANATNAIYQIHYAAGTQSVVVDQSMYNDEWVSLGIYPFESSGGHVYLGDATGIQGQHIGYDAIRWEYQGSGVEDGVSHAKTPRILQCRNPVFDNLRMTVYCSIPGEMTIGLYAISGQCVKEQVMRISSCGQHRVIMDVSDCASGVYMIMIGQGTLKDTKKIVIIND
jgi:hypothetical protein